MTDVDLLKVVTDTEATDWGPAEVAVSGVLLTLHNHPDNTLLWHDIYHAIKDAYAGNADWGDEDA